MAVKVGRLTARVFNAGSRNRQETPKAGSIAAGNDVKSRLDGRNE
jgi:hypothetical protein